MSLLSIVHSIGRAIDPAGPEVYDYNHHLGRYEDEDCRRSARFSRDGEAPYYSPYYDEWFDDDDMPL